jgi:peptidoglycan/LPS O-acetylase OafA/YrhL
MILTLRILSFVVGVALIVAPSFLLLQFGYGVGEPPAYNEVIFFLPTLGIGLLLGGGLVLAGTKRLVAGASTPMLRFITGGLIIISFLAIVIAGFSGSVTRVVSPVVIVIEMIAFVVFVYPAKHFKN